MKSAVDLQNNAVSLHGACLSFDSEEESVLVLDKFDMAIPRGAIYGLLGASGCGKTSLLTCIAGIRKLRSGQIFVLGDQPGTPGSGVPGPRTGYMPQEVSLMNNLNTRNIMFYFGRLFGMTSDVIEERLEHLSSLLQLQDLHLYIEQLSGGQQRRVSLAAALLHDPELLILDEPTVGLDPMLRQRIWDYLKEMTQLSGTTVLLTTHYIEEARQADVVGLMRQGKLLAESSPSTLMQRHSCDSLELIFLKLAEAQRDNNIPPLEPYKHIGEDVTQNQQVNLPRKNTKSSFFSKMHALILRNILGYFRDRSSMVGFFLLTVLHLIICDQAVGHPPQQVPLAVVNDELPHQTLSKLVSGDTSQQLALACCESSHLLSCDYIDIIKSNFSLHYYSDVASAEAAARSGHVRGVVHFGKDFSKALKRRFLQHLLHVSDVTLDQSQISVRLDMSDYITGLSIKYDLRNGFTSLVKQFLKIKYLKQSFADLPMRLERLYSHGDGESYTLFICASALITIVYSLNLGLSFQYILRDFNDGTWTRNRNSGVSVGEVLTSHVVSQFILVLLQTAEGVFVSIFIVGLENRGSVLLVVAITFLSGLFGICSGMLVSSLSQNYTAACFLYVGSFLTNMITSGVIWPVTGMPWSLRVVCEQLPLTTMIVSLRNILSKGLGFSNPVIYQGFISSTLCSVTCLYTAYVIHKSHE